MCLSNLQEIPPFLRPVHEAATLLTHHYIQSITVKPESSEDSVTPKSQELQTLHLCSFLNMYLLGEERKGAFSEGARGTRNCPSVQHILEAPTIVSGPSQGFCMFSS